MNPIHHQAQVRVRFAPSPTGRLHIGGLRTVLFNWLFARKHKGVFILRIEDTDRARSRPEYERDVLAGIVWAGMMWDEGPVFHESGGSHGGYEGMRGPYRQSERLDIYEKYITQLFRTGAAYRCFCAKETLETEKQARLTQGLAPRYGGRCRALSAEEVGGRLQKGEPSVIRFKTPETKVSFKDLIRGEVIFDMGLVGDFVIARGTRDPLYNFAAAVDDYEMAITHVIRGEEHIANTPKQLLVQAAFGFPHPHFAHLPLILNPDRSKMSKRYAATAVSEYRDAGYLPEAIINFLALLGWHPKDEKEILSPDELIARFELGEVQKGGAIFNAEKLDWLNGQYLKALTDEELHARLITLGVFPKAERNKNRELGVIRLVRGRMKKVSDFKALANFVFELPEYPADLLLWKEAARETTAENLRAAARIISVLREDRFDAEIIEALLAPLVAERGRGELLWPVRVALSGSRASPGPYEIMVALGKEETVRRLNYAIEKLR